MTRVDARPRCPHGRPTAEYCAACVGPVAAAEAVSSVKADLAALGKISHDHSLHLPPLGAHVSRVDVARGRWTVTCACGRFRVRTTDRHEAESAWGQHRHT